MSSDYYYSEEGNTWAGLGCSNTHGAAGSSIEASQQQSVQAFLEQCMEYHEQQNQERQQKQGHHPAYSVNDQVVTNDAGESTTFNPKEQLLQQGTVRAMAIIERLKQQTQEQQQQTLPEPASFTIDQQQQNREEEQYSSSLTPEYFRVQREQCLAREANRRRLAMIRNLEFLTRQRDRHLQQLEHQIQQQLLYENQIQIAQQAALERRRMQQQQQQHQHDAPPARKPHSSSDNTLSLYVSGLATMAAATDNANDSHNDLVATLTSLFAEFASLKKIHLYQNKQTGQLKGDGLVIYHWKPTDGDEQARQEFIIMVCSQVSQERSVDCREQSFSFAANCILLNVNGIILVVACQ
ncbi:hypothetical protein MPSEU_000013600 [Mayamaea pseudoterrestris]|nr:hypothetical protein MPSEU_000013600 [Mayamaea pseudoterrestris]